MNPILIAIIAFVLIMNLISFFQMRHDKQCAQAGKQRVPEKTLFLATALFGGLGGCLGMYLLRHKTKHWYFALFFPLMLIAQVAILVLLYIFASGWK